VPASRYPSTQALIDDLMEFLSGRIGISHNARLVLFLRDTGVLSELETEEILQAGATRGARAAHGDRTLVRSAALMFSVLLLALTATGGAIQASTGTFTDKTHAFGPPSDAPIVPKNAGYIQVVVDPWADVYVDGELVATTPTSQRIALPPGRHYVKYKNPFYEERSTEIFVRPGELQKLEVSLTPKNGAPRAELDPR
jgi:eukaryotic-like serine/threonine-protein kinase